MVKKKIFHPEVVKKDYLIQKRIVDVIWKGIVDEIWKEDSR